MFNANECWGVLQQLDCNIVDEVTATIYHYTRAESFKGIIESRELWMTNAFFVNDITEIRRPLNGKELFRDVQFENPNEFEEFKNEQCPPDDEAVKKHYLVSFSKQHNSLYQFREYGDYCIGFDPQKLERECFPRTFRWFECIYDPKDIKEWIITKYKLPEWNKVCFSNEQGKAYKRAAFDDLKFTVQAKFKNEHFNPENEVRLLAKFDHLWAWDDYNGSVAMFGGQPAIYFKNNDGFNAPVPYVKFFIPKEEITKEELDVIFRDSNSAIEAKQYIRDREEKQERELLPIKEVIIGPMRHQKEAVVATQIFLDENGYDKVKVIPSDIPFRGK